MNRSQLLTAGNLLQIFYKQKWERKAPRLVLAPPPPTHTPCPRHINIHQDLNV